MKKLEMAGSVIMSNQSTIDGLGYMEYMGYIGAGRSAVILNG